MSQQQDFFSIGHLFNHLGELALYEVEHFAPRVGVYTLILSFLIYMLLQRSYKPKDVSRDKLDKETEEELLKDFTPEPLVPKVDESDNVLTTTILTTGCDAHIDLHNQEGVLNFGTHNFLGLANDKNIVAECKKTVEKYGVGACGPRGFYGTLDVHLDLEEQLAKFMGTQTAILYSFGWATISSVIPAFGRVGDLIICDEGCNYAIQNGIYLSRSSVVYFKHNDMAHLEQILRDQAKKDGKKEITNRRFIVFQGVYESTGEIAPLKKILELKHKYCYRLIMDDSFGIGVLGKKGRGTIEHFDVPIAEIDILSATLENSFGSIGGFCVGSPQVVNHQRLGGAAYCFSASLPPYLATASIEALKIIKTYPELLPKLAANADQLIKGLSKILPQPLTLDATAGVPIMHIRLKKNDPTQAKQTAKRMQQVVEQALKQGVAVARPEYSDREYHRPTPSVKVTVSVQHTAEEIDKCVSVLKPILAEVFGN